ncbi:SDR family oxidoreductase [soil metagenome]
MLDVKTIRVVVITGGTAGVGRATARAFARMGADVAVLARGAAGLEATQAEIEAMGRRALAVPTDVADPEQVEQAAAQVERELGPIDVWVNAAMTTVFAPVLDTDVDDFRRATEVTYLGSVHGTLAALKRMRERDAGTIVQVGSALAYRSIPLQAAYCGAKAAIRGFLDSLRCELHHEGSHVRLTMVHLPAHNTPQFEWCRTTLPRSPQPVPPIFQPEVAADAIVWAARHPRRELLVGGPTLQAVWANKFVPGLLDRYLARTAWSGQQSEQPVPERRPDNLWSPVPEDHGARGRFGASARTSSLQLWATTHRAATAAALFGAALMVAGVARLAKRIR